MPANTHRRPEICPSCSDVRIVLVGPIPNSHFFAGKSFFRPICGGELYRCDTCFLYFRHPRPNQEELYNYYKLGSELAWESKAAIRQEWKIAIDWIRSTIPAGATIVDLGCSEGGFLELLGQDYKLFGVEINESACACATARGIEIIGHDLNTVFSSNEKYDCIVAFDVIEHILDPARFMAEICKTIRPEGIIIIATGNTSANSWRLMGSRYWYCALSEHISFLNLQWCNRVAQNLGLQIERYWFYSHLSVCLFRRWREALLNLIYRFWLRGFSRLRRLGFGDIDIKNFPDLLDYPPSWMSAKDHMLVIFRKTNNNVQDTIVS